jgi:hypothetical protein
MPKYIMYKNEYAIGIGVAWGFIGGGILTFITAWWWTVLAGACVLLLLSAMVRHGK